MAYIFSLIALWFFVGIKFLISPATVLAFGLSKFETLIFVFCASSFWSIFFFYMGQKLQQWYYAKFPPKKKKKIFTKSKRRLVRIKNSFGSWGFAFAIVVMSIPISALLASKYFKHEKNVWLKYVIACGFWTVILTFFSHAIGELILGK